MKVIIDCNILISAALFKKSKPAMIVKHVAEQSAIIFSPDTFHEFQSTLLRSKFDKYIRENDRLVFIDRLFEKSTLVNPNIKIAACKDPNDDMYLELAIEASVDCIVTGDKALLELHPFRGIPILTPAEFFDAYMDI